MNRLFLILFFALQVFGAEWFCTWDANTEPDLAGYRFYLAIPGGVVVGSEKIKVNVPLDSLYFTQIGEIDTNYFKFELPPIDKPCCFVTAFDFDNNESGPSNVVCGLVGDYNYDGIVDPEDADSIRVRYGQYVDNMNKYNLNMDNIIDPEDLDILRTLYGDK